MSMFDEDLSPLFRDLRRYSNNESYRNRCDAYDRKMGELKASQDLQETPAHVVREPASTAVVPGLETPEIAQAFDGVMEWSATRWQKNLSAAKWAALARIALGEQGGASALWNPLMLAQLLHGKGADMKLLRGRFQRIPALEPWRAAFNEYYETHCAED